MEIIPPIVRIFKEAPMESTGAVGFSKEVADADVEFTRFIGTLDRGRSFLEAALTNDEKMAEFASRGITRAKVSILLELTKELIEAFYEKPKPE